MIKVQGMPGKVETAIYNVVSARAAWETVDEMDHNTKNEILNNHGFYEEDSGKRILDTISDFLMSESDFMKYCVLVYERNCEKGFDSGSPELNFYPLRKAVYEAEDKLIDTIAADVPEYTPEVIKAVKTNDKQRTRFLAIMGL